MTIMTVTLGSLTPAYTPYSTSSVRITPQSFSFGIPMCGMPCHRTYGWLQTMIPTQTAGLNAREDKEQHPSYPESFPRTVVLVTYDAQAPGLAVACSSSPDPNKNRGCACTWSYSVCPVASIINGINTCSLSNHNPVLCNDVEFLRIPRGEGKVLHPLMVTRAPHQGSAPV
jgi:hypothetical protein